MTIIVFTSAWESAAPWVHLDGFITSCCSKHKVKMSDGSKSIYSGLHPTSVRKSMRKYKLILTRSRILSTWSCRSCGGICPFYIPRTQSGFGSWAQTFSEGIFIFWLLLLQAPSMLHDVGKFAFIVSLLFLYFIFFIMLPPVHG